MSKGGMIAGGINLVAGLWLMLSAFMMGIGFFSNLFVVGILAVMLALIELSMEENIAWFGWTNSILGLWLLVSPLFLPAMTMGLVWNSIIIGLIMTISAIWGTMSSSSMGHGHPKMG